MNYLIGPDTYEEDNYVRTDKRFWLSFFLWIVTFIPSVSLAADRIRIGYSSISADQISVWASQEAGTYKKYGLDAELIFFGSGTLASQALISGEVPLAALAGPGVVNAAVRGADVVMVMGGINAMVSWILTKPSIRAAEQLKGKRVAISRFGSSTEFAARYAASKLGLNPHKDVILLQIGSLPARLQALEQGAVDAAVVGPPINFIGEMKGYYRMADLAEMGLAYPMQALATTTSYMNSHREVVKRAAKAQIESIARFKNDPSFGVQVLKKYFPTLTDEVIRRTYEMIRSDQIQPKDQAPSLAAVQTVLEEVAMRDPTVKKYKPAQFVDMSLTDEIKKEGFVNQVYVGYKK